MAILQSESSRINDALNALNDIKGVDIDVQVMHPNQTFELDKFTFCAQGLVAEGKMKDVANGDERIGEVHFNENGGCVTWTQLMGDCRAASLFGISITTNDDGLGAMLELIGVIIDDEISFDLF